MTQQQALQRLTALCSQAEHCTHEMREKMQRWELDATTQQEVIDYLIRERYVDDERYARYLVREKVKFNKWGRRKVQQALMMKHIDSDIQQRVLDEVSDDEYLDILRPLLQQKRRSTRAASEYEMNCKLIRFAQSRGFTYDIIRQALPDADVDCDE